MADDPDPDTSSEEQPATDASSLPAMDEAPRAQPATELDKQMQRNSEALNEHLNNIAKESGASDARMQQAFQSDFDALQKLINEPAPARPTPQALPPPPTEAQKNDGATAIMKLLTLGTTLAIAYGATARKGGIVQKAALAGALGGWAEGNQTGNENAKKASDRSLQLWEKMRQFVNDENKEQNAQYNALLADKRLSLTQQMDLLKARAEMYQNYRANDAASTKNLVEFQKMLQQQEKLQRDYEKTVLAQRTKLWELLGRGKEAHDYEAWVLDKSSAAGNPIRLSDRSDVEKYNLAARNGYSHEQYLKDLEQKAEAKRIKELQEKTAEEQKKRFEKRAEEQHEIEFEAKKAEAVARAKKRGAEEPEPTDTSEDAKKAARILKDLVQ